MPCIERNQYTTCTALVVVNISATLTSFFGDVSVAQLVASMSGVVPGGVVMVVGSNLASGKIFSASKTHLWLMMSLTSVWHSLYLSTVLIYCLNLHQFLILCSSKVVMFVKLYLSNITCILGPIRLSLANVIDSMHWMSMSGVMLGGVVMVVGSNLARGKIFSASVIA